MLASSDRFYRPYVHIGLASVCRREGRTYAGLQQLATLEHELDHGITAAALAPTLALPLFEERARCYLELGVFDLADADIEAFAAQAKDAGPAETDTAARLAIDLRMARGQFAAARQIARRARASAEQQKAEDGVLAGLRLRELVAEQRAHPDRFRLVEVAFELGHLHEHGLAPGLRYRAAFDAALAWLDSGQFERASAATAELHELAAAGAVDRIEAMALSAHLALARGSDHAALASFQRELAKEQDELFAQWRAMPLREGGTGMLAFADRREALNTLLELDRRTLGDGAFTAAYGHLEAQLALGTMSRRLGAASPTLAATRRELVPDHGGLLLFSIGRSGGHLLAIDAATELHESFAFDAGLLADFEMLIVATDQQPTDADRSIAELRRAGERLSARMLSPALTAKLATWQQVVLVGSDRCATVFHALPWGTSWLALTHALRTSPSLALLAQARSRAARRPAATSAIDLAVVGDPTLDAAQQAQWRLEPIGFTADQRRRLLQPFAATRTTARWDQAATAAALRDPAVAGARVLFVLCHGVRDYQRERWAGILLATDGDGRPLFAEDIEGTACPTIVVLGVCGATNGPMRLGDDGVGHLGGAFYAAGADSILSSKGALPIGATHELVTAFGSELGHGRSTALALLLARRTVAADPARRHPHYFASLQLSGLDVTPFR